MKKKSPQSEAKGIDPAPRRSSPWHAVSVVIGGTSCESARASKGTRYLSREAPRLPLARCTLQQACSCSYKHYGDRRGRPRRKDEVIGLRQTRPMASERRQMRGRRADD
jgi:hypothetical protein